MKLKIDKRGYVRITADPTRTAWEHIRVAEAKLGRRLGKTEQVHHINGDKTDNRPENLIVFRSNSDHKRYHSHIKIAELLQTSDGSYIAVTKQRECPNCLRLFVPTNSDQLYCGIKCYKKHKCRNIPNKEELIEDLKTYKSVVAISKKYGVSDNTIRKWCIKYGLPTKVNNN